MKQKFKNLEMAYSDYTVFDRRFPRQVRSSLPEASLETSFLDLPFSSTRNFAAPSGLFEAADVDFSATVVDTTKTCGAYATGQGEKSKLGYNIDCTGFFWRSVFAVLTEAKSASRLTETEIKAYEKSVILNWGTHRISKEFSLFATLNTKASISDPNTIPKGDFVLMFIRGTGHIVIATKPFQFCHSGSSRGCEVVNYRISISDYFKGFYSDPNQYSIYSIDWAKMFTFIYKISIV